MAMKEARPGACEARAPRIPQSPVSEERMKLPGSFYFHLSDPAHAVALFKSVEKQLQAMGYGCSHGNLQADPHPSLSVLDTFDVFLRDGRRQPELFGTVTVYGTLGPKPLPRTIKFDPVYPDDDETFLKALGIAIETTLPDYSVRGSEREVAMALTKEPEHSFSVGSSTKE